MNSRYHQPRPWGANVDLYRKIPTDLMEGTRRGSILSYLALALMVILFVAETTDFFSGRLETYLAMDVSGEGSLERRKVRAMQCRKIIHSSDWYSRWYLVPTVCGMRTGKQSSG